MPKNLVQRLSHFFPGYSIEERILYGVCLLTGVAGVFAGLLSLGPMQSPASLVLICFGGGLAGFAGWYLGHFHRLFNLSFLLLLTTQVACMSLVFYYDGGIYGPSVFFFVTWVPVYIFILRAPLAILASVTFFTAFTLLYFLQINDIVAPVDYSSDSRRNLDVYSGFVFHFVFTALIAAGAKIIFKAAQTKAEASNRAKSQFLANISHEIRTPMNAILGLNTLALERCTDTQQQLWLKSSQDAAEHLLNLIEAMLDISTIDEGKLVIRPQLFSPRELVSDVVNIMRQFADQKKLAMNLDIATDLPDSVMADSVRLRQVLVNLINNAIKFTHAGSIHVSVKLEQVRDQNAELFFTIQDTGIGIPADEQEKIFDIFTRGENLDHFRYKGFGLGLSISKQLIEKMGGRIWLESRPAQGSSFYFTLPIQILRRPVVRAKPVSGIVQTPDNPYRLLLAEDNDINAEVARQLLQKQGFVVDRVANGAEALSQLALVKYSAILMDLEMPEMDGFEATRALQAGEAGSLNQKTAVIAVTAHALREYEERCRQAGMQGFIAKPFSSEVLLREVCRFIPDSVQDFQI